MRHDEDEADARAQEAQPFPHPVLHPFQTYLQQQQLSWLTVAREADMRCLLVWNIAHGVPVRGRQAARVRVAVHRLSSIAYTGPMNSYKEEPGQKPQQALVQTAGWEVAQ